MCKRCKYQEVIHNGKELQEALDHCPENVGYLPREELMKLWWKRNYFDNLVYLEYIIES